MAFIDGLSGETQKDLFLCKNVTKKTFSAKSISLVLRKVHHKIRIISGRALLIRRYFKTSATSQDETYNFELGSKWFC